MCQFDVGHQTIGHDGCLDDWAHRNALTSREPLREHGAGYQDVLVSIVAIKGLDERGKVLADIVSRRCQANMADFHCVPKSQFYLTLGRLLRPKSVV